MVRERGSTTPAEWGSATLLVNEAGLAPVLWLQDEQGFTLDRVAVPVPVTTARAPTVVPLAAGASARGSTRSRRARRFRRATAAATSR